MVSPVASAVFATAQKTSGPASDGHGEAGIQEERQGACLGLSLDRTQDLRLPQKLTGDGILCHSGGDS